MRVLVAEDDDGLREVLVLGLAEQGYQVDAVDRGDDAIDQLKWYEYDVAIIDWRMPGRARHRRGGLGASQSAADGPAHADRPRRAAGPHRGTRRGR